MAADPYAGATAVCTSNGRPSRVVHLPKPRGANNTGYVSHNFLKKNGVDRASKIGRIEIAKSAQTNRTAPPGPIRSSLRAAQDVTALFGKKTQWINGAFDVAHVRHPAPLRKWPGVSLLERGIVDEVHIPVIVKIKVAAITQQHANRVLTGVVNGSIAIHDSRVGNEQA